MSDSFPPDDEGPDPYLGQDLDGLLSGDNCCVPEALRPVVPTLDALRAAPVRAELLGEAAARAYFREVMLAGEDKPARPNAGAGEARTLILPTGTPGGGPHPAPRRHRHRRPSQRGRWQAKALVGVAAAAIVGAAALAGTFSGFGGHPAVAGRSHGAASPTGPASGSHGVDGNGTPDPSVKPTPGTSTSQQSGDGPSPRHLCSEYFNFLADPGQYASPAAEKEIRRQLNSLADGQGGIAYYCMRLLQLWAVPPGSGKSQGMPGYSYPGELPGPQSPQGPQGDQGSQGSQGSQGAGSSPGHGGNGSGNNGNGNNGGNSKGQGGNGGNGQDQGGNGPGSGARTSGR